MRTSTLTLLCVGLLGAISPARSAEQYPSLVDNRIPISVTRDERTLVLSEMREFLHHLFNIHNALARKDMEAVARASEPLGNVLDRMPPKLRERLPVAFLEMGHGMHELFAVMARDATTKADVNHTLNQMAEALSYCSGCHDTYRFQEMTLKPATPPKPAARKPARSTR
jgi:hypothetical protein